MITHPFAGIIQTPAESPNPPNRQVPTGTSRRSFLGKTFATTVGALAAFFGFRQQAQARLTVGMGEQGGITTNALGEEGAPPPPTYAYGEQGGITTYALGEEGAPPPPTTAYGEQGSPTTYRLGEEGAPPPPTNATGEQGHWSTIRNGEEGGSGPTNAIGGGEGGGPGPTNAIGGGEGGSGPLTNLIGEQGHSNTIANYGEDGSGRPNSLGKQDR